MFDYLVVIVRINSDERLKRQWVLWNFSVQAPRFYSLMSSQSSSVDNSSSKVFVHLLCRHSDVLWNVFEVGHFHDKIHYCLRVLVNVSSNNFSRHFNDLSEVIRCVVICIASATDCSFDSFSKRNTTNAFIH